MAAATSATLTSSCLLMATGRPWQSKQVDCWPRYTTSIVPPHREGRLAVVSVRASKRNCLPVSEHESADGRGDGRQTTTRCKTWGTRSDLTTTYHLR
ncbi:hypothetical protein BKA81DRAFT_71683 [Phyllosticta paracitricarpa]|uniref:Secreted protein n=1 Tax=Phyllosticta paracitricarpa TaxID=2016321 RepID=A0ABR1NDX1_9PEZI